jgi:hypothetical protein
MNWAPRYRVSANCFLLLVACVGLAAISVLVLGG